MKSFKKYIMASLLLLGLVAPIAIANSAFAAVDPQEQACQGSGGTWDPVARTCGGQTTTNTSLQDVIKNIVNILLFIIGVASVIMIIIGGLRYVLSGGDAAGITGAKNTIIYAIIGLVVAVLAYALVNFVLSSL